MIDTIIIFSRCTAISVPCPKWTMTPDTNVDSPKDNRQNQVSFLFLFRCLSQFSFLPSFLLITIPQFLTSIELSTNFGSGRFLRLIQISIPDTDTDTFIYIYLSSLETHFSKITVKFFDNSREINQFIEFCSST